MQVQQSAPQRGFNRRGAQEKQEEERSICSTYQWGCPTPPGKGKNEEVGKVEKEGGSLGEVNAEGGWEVGDEG